MSEYQANIVTRNPATPGGPSPLGAAPGIWRLNDVAAFTKQGVWPDANVDPYWAYTSLLLSTTSLGNASNNLFVDSSGAFNPISRNGNTTQGSFTPYAANWSNYFDGTGDYLTAPSNAAFAFGTGDFTIEFWVNVPNFANFRQHVSTRTSETTSYWSIDSKADGVFYFYTNTFVVTTAAQPANTWLHIAAVRSSGTLTLYVNGVAQSSATATNNFLESSLGIGASPSGQQPMTGYLSNVRLVKGTAVYTSNFTPPPQPLSAIGGTSILTCQSNRFRDASTNNFTITRNGDTSVQEFNPFILYPSPITYNQSDITNWSGYFDGTGDYLTAPYTTANFDWYTAGTDFTIEAWFYANTLTNTSYPNGGTQAPVMCGNRDPNAGTDYWSFGPTSEGIVAFYYFSGSAQRVASTTTISAGRWNHVAMTKTSSGITLFVNGTAQTTVAISGTPQSSASFPFAIGQGGSSSYSFPGYISNLRVVRGTAIYSGNFTPPTSPLTAVANTKILTLQNAAFTDNSTNNLVITPNGNVTVTGNSPFNTVGYWSNYFDGSGDYLSAASNTAFDCSTGNWTIEGWVNITTRTTNYPLFFGNNRGGFTTDALALTVSNSDNASYNDKFVFAWGSAGFSSPSAGSAALLVSNVTNDKNTWYHFAVVRNGTSIKMYRNGVEVASATVSSGATFNWGFNGVLVGGGNWDGANSYINGYISNLRLVKGTAVYTAAFTPPSAPLTAISGTSLLTCQNGRFIDNSTNAFTITANGNTSVQSFDPFYTSTIASNGGSSYFDNTGDYLAIPASPALALGSSAFTLEAWVYGSGSWSTDPIFECRASGGSSSGYAFLVNSSGYLNVYTAGAFVGNSSTTLNLNSWNHVALVRTGTGSNQTTYYINGVASGTITLSGNFTDAITNETKIGGSTTAGEIWNGYIASARITKAAVYTTAFTPSTTPLTPSANTVLLVNGMNAGIFDASGSSNMETVGNAQVSTVQSKFGGSSVYFDGSGDYLSFPVTPQFGFGTGNYTVEFWLYLSALPSSGKYTLMDFRTASTAQPHTIYVDSSGYMGFFNGSSDVTSSSQPLSANTWYHIAYSRGSGTLKIFVNGAQAYSAANTVDYQLTRPLTIGAAVGGIEGLNGYIDDFRITKGVARYTATFTPPTAPFPTY